MTDDFDDPTSVGGNPDPAPQQDKKWPEPKRDRWGRYMLPEPGERYEKSWQRATTLIKMASDTYHLERWKERTVAKGVASRPDLTALAATLDVKRDKEQFDRLCAQAFDVAGGSAGASLGTALHSMAEGVDETGSMDAVPELYRSRLREYNAELAAKGISIIPGFIERQTLSVRWKSAGTLDRGFRLADGSNVIGDLKTGSTLDFGFKEIEAQLAIYEDGVNTAGVWTGTEWDTSVKVRHDIGLVVHLPSDKPGCFIYVADLANGRRLLEVCAAVRDERKFKSPLVPYTGHVAPDGWEERLNAATSYDELLRVVGQIKAAGQWTRELSHIARKLAGQVR